MRKRNLTILLIGVPLICLLCVLVYFLPPVNDRLAWRVDELRTRVKYALNPPAESLFIPQQDPAVTVITIAPTTTPTGTLTATPSPVGPTNTPAPTFTPTLTPTPLPEAVYLQGVKYEDQHNRWNYCGPANLSMAMTYWGWDGNRDIVGEAVKPNDKDKNVMPYEMQDFVADQGNGLETVVRFGGDIDLIRRLVANGFPVMAEKGYYEIDYTGTLGWLGHYQFINGYDDAKQVLIVQDTYVRPGIDHEISYEDFIQGWRSFNYLFMVVFPADRAEEVYATLGPYADLEWSNRHALEIAEAESQLLTGIDLYFAYFNIGTSHVSLQEYGDATYAYDYAFETVYPSLPVDGMRPYRVMWYQTWPYWAYFYSGRYQDVIDLANWTLIETISEPLIEESFYWRGLAREALGDIQGATDDMRQSVNLNPNFTPGWAELNRLTGGG